MKKKPSLKKFPSHSTPGHEMDLPTWLVEIAMTRKNNGVRLPARYWSLVKYKFIFLKELKAVKSYIKKYGEKAILQISLKNYLTTYTDYAQMQYMLQKIEEGIKRREFVKDTSEVKSEEIVINEDFRENIPKKQIKKSIFKRIGELNANN